MAQRAPRQGADDIESVQSRIRDAGLRCTAARLAVMQYLMSATGPLTHAEVSEAVGPVKGFDRATIYRNLTELTEARLVSRMELGDHVWRFELRRPGGQGGRPGEHPHFVCDTCGTVSCLEGVEVAITPKPRATRVDNSPQTNDQRIGAVREVLLKGQCPQCE